jgi:transposase
MSLVPPVSASLSSAGSPSSEVTALRDVIAVLQGQLAALLEQNRAQRAVIAAQSARIAELERRLGLNSTNSGKPPSSDGLNKQPARTKSLRDVSGKKTGGQKGHPGSTLRRTDEPDATVDHFPGTCRGCGGALDQADAAGFNARQVFDLPEPQPILVTEHRAHSCVCARCGVQTQAPFPADVTAPVQYGQRVGAFVLYLLHYQLLPEKRLMELMADLFGLKLATATIARISREAACRLQGFSETVRAQVATAPVKHMDETGFRIGGETRWLHVACTLWLTFYRVSAKRGSLLADVTGIVVHDHWKPYYTLTGVLHALCNAHHLRELQALIEIEKEDWARKMGRLLRRACHAAHVAREQGVALDPRLLALIDRRYEVILAQGFAFHEAQAPLICAAVQTKRRGRPKRRTGHNLLLRLRERKPDVLRFLVDPTVPFTNNLAERDGRMMKLRQKISGGFRSLRGAEDFAIIRTLISTARKQGWDLLTALSSDPKTLAEKLRLA